jgi:anti-sigma B factor antagonist
MRTAMQMTERVVGGVTILDLTGSITIDQDAGRLKDKINSLIQQARTSVVLNLAEVSYIDSGGLGQLVASYASLAKTTGGLKLLHLTKRNHDLLSITRLVRSFRHSRRKMTRSGASRPSRSGAASRCADPAIIRDRPLEMGVDRGAVRTAISD